MVAGNDTMLRVELLLFSGETKLILNFFSLGEIIGNKKINPVG